MVVVQPSALHSITAAALLFFLGVSALPAAIPSSDYSYDDSNRNGRRNGPSDNDHIENYQSNHIHTGSLSKDSTLHAEDHHTLTGRSSAAGTTPGAAIFSFPDLVARDPIFPPFPSTALSPLPPPSFPSFWRPPISPPSPPTQHPPFLSPGLSDDPALHRHSHVLVKAPPSTTASSPYDSSSAAASFAAAREQILHHCTTHFVALLDSEISDRLQVQLSRLVMMLPVLGVETRAQMRSKVVQVVQQEILHRLSDYSTIHRIIQTAVNDAGLLSWPENQAHSIKSDDENDDPNGEDGIETVYEQEEMTMSRKDSLYSRAKGDSEENDTEREEEHKNSTSEDDSNERHDDKNEDESEENDDGDDDDDNNNSEDSQQTRSPWSRLTASFRRQRKDKDNTAAARVRPASTPHHHRPKSSTKTIVSISGVDESQIPEVTEVAMDAVLEYMAEILAPGLVIHQLTEAIQSALYQIKKTTKNQAAAIGTKKSGYLSGDMARLGWDMDALERMTSGLGKHSHNIDSEDNGSLELLGDNWFLSGADADNSRSQDDEDDGEGPNSDELLLGLQESEDEDIWSDGSDEIDWDKPGHLFDDLAEESNTEVFSTLDPPISKSPRSSRASSGEDEQVELDGGISSSNGDEDEGEDGDETVSDSFSVGIRNEDDPYEDIGNSDDDADGMVESSEDYNRDTAPFSVKKPQKAFNYPDNHPELFERLRQRFQKRFLVAAASSSGSISSQASSTHPFRIDSVTESAYRSFDKRSRADTVNGRSQHSAGISIASDPRLEDLLTQLIKPLLVSFVDEDFPESCRRFQGELMDSIILALDQLGSSSSGNGLSEEDQILLFAELGY